jgi:hypothetical protein
MPIAGPSLPNPAVLKELLAPTPAPSICQISGSAEHTKKNKVDT